MARKIEVWVNKNQVRRGGDGYDGGQIITNVYEPTHEDGDEDWNTKATLVISDERVFTDSEVRQLGLAAISKVREGHVIGMTNVGLAAGSIAAAFADAGIVLDPA